MTDLYAAIWYAALAMACGLVASLTVNGLRWLVPRVIYIWRHRYE